MHVPTMKIKHPSLEFVIINVADFDSATMERYEEPDEAKPKAKSEPMSSHMGSHMSEHVEPMDKPHEPEAPPPRGRR